MNSEAHWLPLRVTRTLATRVPPKPPSWLPVQPRWLPLEVVCEINRHEVGEAFAVVDQGRLESVVNKPQQLWHDGKRDVVHLASALLVAIASGKPFQDGNSRTAFTAAVVFLELNGYTLNAPDSEEFAKVIMAVLTGKIPEHAFVKALAHAAVRPVEHEADEEAREAARAMNSTL